MCAKLFVKIANKWSECTVSGEMFFKGNGWKRWKQPTDSDELLPLPCPKPSAFRGVIRSLMNLSFSSAFVKTANKWSECTASGEMFYKGNGWKRWKQPTDSDELLPLPCPKPSAFRGVIRSLMNLSFSSAFVKTANKWSECTVSGEMFYKGNGWKRWKQPTDSDELLPLPCPKPSAFRGVICSLMNLSFSSAFALASLRRSSAAFCIISFFKGNQAIITHTKARSTTIYNQWYANNM